MRKTAIGKSPLQVGVIAYGCWRLAGTSPAEAATKVNAALDAGMTLIDTADIYGFGEPTGFGGAEALLGEVLMHDPQLRGRMVLATKGGIIPPRPYDSSRAYLTEAIDASLRRLNVEQIDLYQIHRPDLLAPVEETADALNAAVASGRVRYIGVSNFTVAQTRALQAHLDAPLISTQPEFSASRQEPLTDGTLDWCSETGAACLAWSPLAGGSLVDGGGQDSRQSAVIATLDRIAATHSATRSQVAIAFTMRHQANVIPIIGTQTLSRIAEATEAANLILDAREFYDIVEAYRGEPMP